MTYRERIKRQMPEFVQETACGGVCGCPGDYWEGATIAATGSPDCSRAEKEACRSCWDKEASPLKVRPKRRKVATRETKCVSVQIFEGKERKVNERMAAPITIKIRSGETGH